MWAYLSNDSLDAPLSAVRDHDRQHGRAAQAQRQKHAINHRQPLVRKPVADLVAGARHRGVAVRSTGVQGVLLPRPLAHSFPGFRAPLRLTAACSSCGY
jgi:hypothetical protein